MAFSLMAITFGTSALINCRTVEIVSTAGAIIEAGVFAYKTVGFVETSEAIYAVSVCQSYKVLSDDFGFDYETDKLMQTLERIAITVPVIGGIALIGNGVALCAGSPNPMIWKFFGLCFIVCSILQGVGLKIMDSYICTNNPVVQYMEENTPSIGDQFQSDCVFGMGMRLGISAVVFWAVAGLACLATKGPDLSGDSPEEK